MIDNEGHWDYIIVGGGSSGCVLANRLSEDPNVKVLLLEAGRSDAHLYSRIPAAIGFAITNPTMNWQYHSQPDPSRDNRSEMWPAGRMLGGGSAINGMMHVRGHQWDYDHWESLGNSGWGYKEVLPYGATPYTKPAVNMAVGLCRVASRGQIRLASSDPLLAPIIDYSLFSNDDDVNQLMEGVRLTRRLYKTKAFGVYFKDERKPGPQFESDDELKDCIRQQSFLMYHPCGTCSMGTHDEAVVDPQLRVHGVSGLWVADASVFPTLPAGNINATCVMVGEKVADLIRAVSCYPEPTNE